MNYGRGRILIMDDEHQIRMMAEEMLCRIGYTASSVSRGEEAVDAYRKEKESGNPYDAVILDINVAGGMGGEDTMKKLREMEPKIRAIVSSGDEDSLLMTDFRRYGFSAVLPKPYSIQDLTAAVQQVFTGESSNQLQIPG